jgi:plastocyanin
MQNRAFRAIPLSAGLLWFLFSPLERAVCLAQVAAYSDIRGTITITGTERPDRRRGLELERYPGHGEHALSLPGNPMPPVELTLSERAVVYLEGDLPARGKYSPPEEHPVLDQKNLQFHPEVLPILVGTTVEFPNRDNLFHNVFSYSRPKEFDLGRYPKDDSRSVLFDRPGLVRVYCDIHADMYATILVLPHPYFATPDKNGQYTIRRVPEGKYTIVFWMDRNVVERRSIVVRAGEATEADFTF